MRKTAFLLAGQGAQFPGMGKPFYENIPLAKQIFDEAEQFRPGTLASLADEHFEGLDETKNTQIAVFLMDYVCGKILMEQGISPAAMAGFSLGELAALCLAGSMTLEEGIRLVSARGEYMQICGDKYPGKMAAVIRPDEDRLRQIAGDNGVYIANVSSAQQISVSGAAEDMDRFEEALKSAGMRFVPVKVSGAFHTPLMQEASEKLGAVLAEIDFRAPQVPVWSDQFAQPYPAEAEEIRKMLQAQITHPVLFRDILTGMQKAGIEQYVECGPGHTLSGFVRKTLAGTPVVTTSDLKGLQETLTKCTAQTGEDRA